MNRKIRTAAVAAVGTVAAASMVGPPAEASPDGDTVMTTRTGTTLSGSSWDYRMYTNDDNPGGRVTFKTYGDVMRVCDIQADGWAARVRVWDYSASNEYKYTLWAGGNDTCATAKASYGGRYNLKEGHTFHVIVDLVRSSGANFGDVAFWWNG